MGLTLSKQIESRLATLALLEVLVVSPDPNINSVLDHIKYFRIQRDVARYIRDMTDTEGKLIINLQNDWKAMARTQVAAFTADTAIDLVKDTFLQHFQVQLAASVSLPPNISASVVAERTKTFTETFINNLIDDVLKKSISPSFYDMLYTLTPPSKPTLEGEPSKKPIELHGSEQEVNLLRQELGFQKQSV
jgi:hypothetical protein